MGAAACIALNRIASVWSARIDRPSCYLIGLLINEDIESRTCFSNQSRSNRLSGVDFQVDRPTSQLVNPYHHVHYQYTCKQIPTITKQPTNSPTQSNLTKQNTISKCLTNQPTKKPPQPPTPAPPSSPTPEPQAQQEAHPQCPPLKPANMHTSTLNSPN